MCSSDLLYVGGMFVNAGAIRVNHIAKWDGVNWSALGSGTDGEVDALTASGGSLFVGGNFARTGQSLSAYFGIWHPPPLQASANLLANNTIVISWNSQPGQTYQMLSTTDLSQPFTALGGLITSAGTTTSYTNSAAGGNARFFQIAQ